MKILAIVALLLGSAAAASAQTIPVIHHSVSTDTAAQAAFDRGLMDYYAYNPEAAEHEFYTAADLDPHLAMAYWGIALSNAPNLNVAPTDERSMQARFAIERARVLEAYASVEDRRFIEAAVARFDDKTKAAPATLLTNYRDALRALATAYPNDPDSAALYAEAALYVAVGDSLNRIEHWTPAQRTAFATKIGALLPYFQASLAKFPKHVGLLHFFIHAAQLAERSELAVTAAIQLAAFRFPPEDSHLTHMPGHTFFDVGMYEQALDVAQRSVAMDYADFDCCHPGFYSAPRYYHLHNVAFLLYAMTQTGHLTEAIAAARRAGVPRFIADQLVAAQDWHGVLAVPYTKGRDPILPFTRALAFAKLDDVADADAALAEIPDAPADEPSRTAIVTAMRLAVAAQIALDRSNDEKALQLLTAASAAATRGDWLTGGVEYPTLYYYSPHMALAELAMRLGKRDVAKAALQAELAASPRSSAAMRALAGLGSY